MSRGPRPLRRECYSSIRDILPDTREMLYFCEFQIRGKCYISTGCVNPDDASHGASSLRYAAPIGKPRPRTAVGARCSGKLFLRFLDDDEKQVFFMTMRNKYF